MMKNNFKILVVFFLMGIALSSPTLLSAQIIDTVMASDGTFDDHVLIYWTTRGNAAGFKVFRSPTQEALIEKDISKDWKQSSFFYDYDVQKGVKYYYRVAVAETKKIEQNQQLDEGHARPPVPIAEEESKQQAALLAYAEQNFDTNDYLDPSVNNVRSGSIRIEMTQPVLDTVFAPNYNLTIDFVGELIASDSIANEPLLLTIFSNKEADFIADRGLLRTRLVVEKQGANYALSATIPFPFPQGLYYYSIGRVEEEEPIHVGRFKVEQ